VIELPLPPKALSPNHVVRTKGRYHAKRRATKDYRLVCAMTADAAIPRSWLAGRVVLDVEYRCAKKALGYVARDMQNALSAMKAGVDGLIDAGVAPNDSKAFLSWGALSLITRQSPKGDGITVTVRRVP
jgi:Holliday junction resolvase RusA-like endonuclease